MTGVTWAADDMCNKVDDMYGVIRDICRKSCGVCVPDCEKPKSADPAVVDVMPPAAAVEEIPKMPDLPMEAGDHIPDPTHLHR